MKRLGLLFGCLFVAGSLSAQDEVRLSEAHRSNFKHWSLGLNAGATASLGDAASYFFGDGDFDAPAGVGGFEIGLRGNLNYWFSPTIGLSGTAGFHNTSGTDDNYYFEGYFLDADLSLLFNLSNMFLYGKDFDRNYALLFGIGLGASYFNVDGYFADGSATGSPTSFTTVLPMKLWYKRQLNETWDLDFIYRQQMSLIDGADGRFTGITSDFMGYLGVGATYNFGPMEKESIVYYSPFEGVFADLSAIKADYKKLVSDDDGDGVSNFYDQDNSTPADVNVGPNGAPLDVDGDGIPDYLDADPFTAKGAKVDDQGRMVDSDGDGVGDHMDKDPNTPAGTLVNFQGVPVSKAGSGGGGVGAYLPSVFFSFNSVTVSDANYFRLAAVANTLKSNPDVNVVLTGYTDASGPEDYNKTLGQRRADEVKQQLVQVFGIDASRIETASSGESNPLANGRNNINRRVDVSVK